MAQGDGHKSSGIRDGKRRGREKKGGGERSFICLVDERRSLEAGSFRMIMIFKLKIRGAIDGDLGRDFPTPRGRSQRRSPEKRDCPSISVVFFARDQVYIWFYRQLGSAVPRCGDTRGTTLRVHLSRTRNIIPARRTPFRLRLRNRQSVKRRCLPLCVVRSRMRGHLVTGIKNRSYICSSLQVFSSGQRNRELVPLDAFIRLDRYLI